MAAPETRGKETATVLRKGLRRLNIATIILYVVMILGGLYVWNNARNTKEALCTYRANLVVSNTQSAQFLKDHPNGVAGVPVKTIAESIANRQNAINSLGSLNCTNVSTSTPTPSKTPKSTPTKTP